MTGQLWQQFRYRVQIDNTIKRTMQIQNYQIILHYVQPYYTCHVVSQNSSIESFMFHAMFTIIDCPR